MADDDIVISGISGKFPSSRNMEEFFDNLMNSVDMVTLDDLRFPVGTNGTGRFGKVPGADLFDNEFFSLSSEISEFLNSEQRTALELVYEAIVDAGLSMKSVSGSRTGVYLGQATCDTRTAYTKDLDKVSPHTMSGGMITLTANRTSYFYNLNGPSYGVDSACSSALCALSLAARELRNGQIDSALVIGSWFMFDPNIFVEYITRGLTSSHGYSKSFDASGDGFGRGESASVVFLQRRKDCKRSYARIVHGKENADGRSAPGFLAPDGLSHYQLIKSVYEEAGIDPLDVTYVEAHGTGTPVGDPQEILGLTHNGLLTKNRKGPLLIGSVKSNCGHSEWGAGLVSVAKVVLSMHSGMIPANLHFKTPNPDIPALLDGSVKVVTEHTKYDGGLVAINSFGLGGTNAHVVIGPEADRPFSPNGKSIRLFTYGGRTEEGARHMLDFAKKNSTCIEAHALLAESAKDDSYKMSYRGFTVLNGPNAIEEIQPAPTSRPPIWFVYTGMGCQWPDMGKDMLKIPAFRDSIERIAAIVKKSFNLDLMEYFTNECNDKSLDKTFPLVVIVCIQIALTDALKAIGIEPDGVIGHSNGEVGCGYADGCLTIEQAVAVSYARGCARNEGAGLVEEGKMAAVGLTWEECQKRCPPGTMAACNNAHDTVTISGLTAPMKKFMEDLTKEGVFVREVQSGNFAYHTPALKKLRHIMDRVLKPVFSVPPKKRTSKWISTSYIGEDLKNPDANFISAEYYVHNFENPVYFHEAVQQIPKNALVIEVGPHGLLLGLVKKTLGNGITPLSLMKRNHNNNAGFFLSNIGQCYLNGLDIDPLKLHPPVKFPVPVKTPMISSAVSKIWDHSISWKVPVYTDFLRSGDTSDYVIDISPGAEFEYLTGHTVEGQVMIPESAFVVLAWKTLAKKLARDFGSFKVQFENVRYLRFVTVTQENPITLSVRLSTASGYFEVIEGQKIVFDGYVRALEDDDTAASSKIGIKDPSTVDLGPLSMSKSEFYTVWRLRGHEHSRPFQGICRASADLSTFVVDWTGNWVLFLNNLLQVAGASLFSDTPFVPSKLGSLTIDPLLMPKLSSTDVEISYVKTEVNKFQESVSCGAVNLQGPVISEVRKTIPKEGTLEEVRFVPYLEKSPSGSIKSLKDYVSNCLDFTVTQLKQLKSEQLPYHATIIKEIVASCSNATPLSMQKFQEMYSQLEDCGLAHTLSSTFQSLAQGKGNVSELLSGFLQQLTQDKLLANLTRPDILKQCLDVLTDNFSGSKMSIFEIDSSQNRVYANLIPLLQKEVQLDWEYYVDENIPVDGDKTTAFDVSTVKWDISEKNGPAPSAYAAVVLKNVLHNQDDITTALDRASSLLIPGGFLIVQEVTDTFPIAYMVDALRKNAKTTTSSNGRRYGMYHDDSGWQKLFAQSDFDVVFQRTDGVMSTLYMLRKRPKIETAPFVIDVDDLNYGWVDELKYTLTDIKELPDDAKIWLVASKYHNGVVGLMKCLKQEGWGSRVRCALISNFKSGSTVPDISEGSKELDAIRAKDLFINVYRDGQWGTITCLPVSYGFETKLSEDASLQQLVWGDMDSLKWVDNVRPLQENKKTRMAVCYAGLTQNDVQVVEGKLAPNYFGLVDNVLGADAAGYLPDGKRVMAALCSACRTLVDTDNAIVCEVPASWSLEQAASVPFAYSTVIYALDVLTRLRQGDNILILDGTEPRGQAAMNVALHAGCNVFVTVSSAKKQQHLRKLFPQIAGSHIEILSQRSLSNFMNLTKGRGMDFIFTTLDGEKSRQSMHMLAKHGQMVQAGQHGRMDFDVVKSKLPLGASFHEADFAYLLKNDKRAACIRKEVSELLAKGVKSGMVKPLERVVYAAQEYHKALRDMDADGVGKTLLKIREENPSSNSKPKTPDVLALTRAKCRPNHSYVIMGGMGGFGLELAHWLVERGCQHLVVSSRSGLTTGYQKYKIDLMRSLGAQVIISKHNAVTMKGAADLLAEAAQMAPLGGVFNVSMVLKDGRYVNQTEEKFRAVCDPKVKATIHFDKLTREVYKDSQPWFVAFSSQSCGKGNMGQSNYGFANSAMERICEKRRADNLHGLAIQWGWIGDVGFLNTGVAIPKEGLLSKVSPQSMESCLEALDKILVHDAAVVGSYIKAEKRRQSVTEEKTDLSISDQIIKLLGLRNPKSVRDDATLLDVGIDSITTTEVKTILEEQVNIVLSNKEIRDLTFKRIREMDAKTASSS